MLSFKYSILVELYLLYTKNVHLFLIENFTKNLICLMTFDCLEKLKRNKNSHNNIFYLIMKVMFLPKVLSISY